MSEPVANQSVDIVRLYLTDQHWFVLEVSPWLYGALVFFLVVGVVQWWRKHRRYEVVSLDISLGGVGKVTLRPKEESLNIAHRIWTELVTRKAALPIDPEHDVLVEVYDSWYALFDLVRGLISEIPARLVREDEGTRELVRISIETLNNGLRPHLTKWQARFRNWYKAHEKELEARSPQEVQRDFPEYEALLKDLLRVNQEMIQYAGELNKLVQGK